MDNTMNKKEETNSKTAGLGIGIITRGNVSIKWMMHMDKLRHFFPIGMFWKYIVVEDESGWAKNRNEVVKRARKENFAGILWCFKGDEEVETIDGLRRIDKIKVGDLVKTHKGRFKKVTTLYRTPYKQRKEIKKIYTPFSDIECTPDHPFLIENKWIRAKNLKKGDKLLYPYLNKKDTLKFDIYLRERNKKGFGKLKKYFNKHINVLDVDEDIAKFLGYYLAEGCTSNDGIRFTFNNKEFEYIDFIKKVCKDKFGRIPTIYSRWATTVKLNIRQLYPVFENWFGKNAIEKRIPEFVFGWNLKNKIAFLKAYIDGDGCWRKDGLCQTTTASKQLYNDTLKLLKDVGIGFSKTYIYGKSISKKKCNGRYIKSSGSFNIFLSKKKTEKLLDLYYSIVNKNFLEIPIIKIEEKGMTELKNQFVYNLEVEDDHTYIVNSCIVHNCDDDVFVPQDVMQTMLAHQKDIVTGIYWTKTQNECPVIFEIEGAGPMYKFPVDKMFKVAGSGMGCVYTSMKVFDDFDKAGIPYFKENWIMELDDGRKMKCPIGEDHYFFHHARKLGYDVWADSSILCDHYDMNNKKFYPSQETVRKLTGEKLDELGRHDVVEKHDKLFGRDPNKKNIVFVNFTANSFAGDELEKRGVGGAETDVINLSQIFANDYDFNVHVFCNCSAPGVYDGVVYHDITTSLHELTNLEADLLISSRNTSIFNNYNFKKDFKAKKVCLWAHDMAGDPVWNDFEKAYPHLDYIFAVSEWHKNDILSKYSFAKEEKFFVARNGVDMLKFKDREKIDKIPGRLIYSSTPYRGLEILAEVFPEIKKRVPHTTLHAYSSFGVYGKEYEKQNEEFQWLYDKLKSMDGVSWFESIPQKDLAKEQMKAELLAYPNIFPETSCLTVMENQAAGTPSVTSNYAALQETVPNNCGIKLDGNPHSDEYKQKFVDEVVSMLTDKDKWNKYHKECLKLDVSWKTIANEWIKEFFPNQIKDDVDSVEKIGNINTEEYWNKVYKKELECGQTIRNDTERFKYILNNLKINYKDPKVLDISCGTGEFTRYVRKEYPNSEIWGSDFSMVAIDHCRQKDRTIFYANHPIFNDDFEEDFFDIVSAQHIIEHLDEPSKLIERSEKLLKKDGTLVLVIPINDEDWKEHQKIYHLNDVEDLLRPYDVEYEMVLRKDKVRKYKDGRAFEEVILFIKFKGEKK